MNAMEAPNASHQQRQRDVKVKALYDKARLLWLSPNTDQDLDEVERNLRQIWFDKDDTAEEEDGESSRKRRKKEVDPCSITGQAGSRLALWFLQSGRVSQADAILQQLQYECRLSSHVLDGGDDKTTNNNQSQKMRINTNVPCRIYDHFLSDGDLQQLLSVFGDIDATYWTDHNYSVEPPSPYFSYLIPLKDVKSFGYLGSLIQRLQTCLVEWQPLLRSCSQVEMWVHNRPAATGHQLHFDTDNEGREGAVRHPLVTCVLYLSEDRGGPTLVTNQRKSSRYPADQGWLSQSVVGRMTAIDGRVLHCVVPGKATITTAPQQRRVTLMLAFWRRIHVRREPGVGAARAFPSSVDDESCTWANRLRDPTVASTSPEEDHPTSVDPEPLNHVFETVRGEPWPVSSGLPSYDCVFQGI